MTAVAVRSWVTNNGAYRRPGRQPGSIADESFVPYVTIPDDLNSGCDTALINGTYSGPTTITAAGTVIENKIINDRLIIQAANVSVRNCVDRAVGTASVQMMIDCRPSTCVNFHAYRTTFEPATLNYYTNSIQGHDWLMERCLVEKTVDGASPVNQIGSATVKNTRAEVAFSRLGPLAWFYNDGGIHVDGSHNDIKQHHNGAFVRIHGSALYGYKFNALGTPALDGSESNRHPQVSQIFLSQHGVGYVPGYLTGERALTLDGLGFPILSSWGGAPLIDHNWVWGGDNGVKAMSDVSFGSLDGQKVLIAMWVLSNTWMDYPRVYGSFPYPLRVDTNTYLNGQLWPSTTGAGWTEATTPAFDFGNRYGTDTSIPVGRRGLSVGVRVDSVAAAVARV